MLVAGPPFFFRMLTDESRNAYWSQSNSFTDVAAGAWYNNAISTMANAGILDGDEDGSFHTDGYITRAEFATIAVRFFNRKATRARTSSRTSTANWAQDYINQAADAGIIERAIPTEPSAPRSRSPGPRRSTMVNRTLVPAPRPGPLPEGHAGLAGQPGHPGMVPTARHAGGHQLPRVPDEEGRPRATKYEVWTKILPIRDWEALEKAWSDANSSDNPGDVV